MRAQCHAEWPIGRQSGCICRSHVELYESQTLTLSDLRSAMRRNQAEESAHLFRVRIDTAEAFDSEGSLMTDVFRLTVAEQRMQRRIDEYAVIKEFDEVVNGGVAANVFDEGFHAGLGVMFGSGARRADYRNQAIARD